MLLNEIAGYHGGPEIKDNTKLSVPLFVALSKKHAKWYAVNRGEGKPVITKLDINPGRILDTTKGDVGMLDVAREANIKFQERPYFFCDLIERHGGDGGNISDLVYVPEFQKQLASMGYDSVKILDVLENEQILALVLFKPSQFSIAKVDQLKKQ